MITVLAVVAGSAPASAGASAWVEPFGAIRLSVGYSASRSERMFAPADAPGFLGPLCPDPVGPRQRMPYSCVTGGRFVHHGLFFDASVGVAPHLTVDLSVPVVPFARFEDDLGGTTVRGVGDIRWGLRAGGEVGPWTFAGAAHVAAPTAPLGLRDREVPLGEGHWDLELGGAVGRSLYPFGWVEAATALRIRIPGREVSIDRGEEWIGSLSGGFTPVQWFAATARLNWILAAPDADSFGLKSPGRRLLQIAPGVLFRPLEDLTVAASLALPVMGARWPSGAVLNLSVGGRIRLRRPSRGDDTAS